MNLGIIRIIDNKINRYYNIPDTFNKNGNSSIITFVNTFSYYQLLKSNCAIDKIDGIFVDGFLHVILHNIFNKKRVNRASFDFSSLADDFFKFVVKNNLNLALIGAREDEIQKAVLNLKGKYNELRIRLFRNGYFDTEADKINLCNTLKEDNIDVVLLGMGTPAQEELAVYLKNKGVSARIFTCGGFITQTSKDIDYYRPIIKKTNLYWLQRAVDYKYIRKRLLINYPINTVRYICEHIILFFIK